MDSQRVNQVLIFLLTACLLALSVPLGLVIWALLSNKVGLTQTGQFGDTFGGTAGAIFNLMGLILVYKSFKEQIQTNKQQKEQQEYELTYKLLEPFLSLIAQNTNLFTELPQLEFQKRLNLPTTPGQDEATRSLPLGFGLLELRQNQFRQIVSHYNILKNRLSLLTQEQKKVVAQNIYDAYAHWLKACYASYVLHFMGVHADPNTVAFADVKQRGAEGVERVWEQIQDLDRVATESGLTTT